MNKKNDTYRQIGIGVPYNMNDKFVPSYKWKKVIYTSER